MDDLNSTASGGGKVIDLSPADLHNMIFICKLHECVSAYSSAPAPATVPAPPAASAFDCVFMGLSVCMYACLCVCACAYVFAHIEMFVGNGEGATQTICAY